MIDQGTEFLSVHFDGKATILPDDPERPDSLIVKIDTGSSVREEDWNLAHTIWGFERGEYVEISRPKPELYGIPAVGIIVRTTKLVMSAPKGTLGVVVDVYKENPPNGWMVLFATGSYDGFSIEQQKEMLEPVGVFGPACTYKFSNVIQLESDYFKGIFNRALGVDTNFIISNRHN